MWTWRDSLVFDLAVNRNSFYGEVNVMATSTMARAGKRATIVGMAAVAAVGILSIPAQASSWTSHISNAYNDFESRRWTDNGGSTTIKFSGCKSDGTQAVTVTLRKDVLGPDSKYSTQTYTNCFKSGGTSTGKWDDHGSGNYYFVVNYGSNLYNPTSVGWVGVYY
ncbi:hypothetical protein [Streptomyces sp. NPDC059168]|uniref:hypothetical protein n=1 Tax=Streptomyces sp. NPDC059168 TaxID=3346753 RepID=UPI00369C0C24